MSRNLIIDLFRRVDGRNWNDLQESFSEEVVYERPGYEPLVGRERVMRFYREERVIAGGDHLLQQIVVDGESAACWGRFVGVHKNGSPIDEGFADVYTFDGDRIKTRRSYFYRPAV